MYVRIYGARATIISCHRVLVPILNFTTYCTVQAGGRGGRGRVDFQLPGERVPYPLHGAMLYVVDAGCYGGFRLLSFEPTGGEEKGSPNSKL
eukprot:COSAG05_NODE_892_length_6724_cov_32.630491_5_plen_92_part_00